MKKNQLEILNNRDFSNKIGKLLLIMIIVYSWISMIIWSVAQWTENNIIFNNWMLFLFFSIGLLSVFFIFLKIKQSLNLTLNQENMLNIFYHFLKLRKYNDDQFIKKFKSITPKISHKNIKIFLEKQENIDSWLTKSCKQLSSQPTKIKYFVIYSLLDLADEDHIYTLKEEDYILKISNLLRIPKQSYQKIKSSFTKKGLKEERKIIEEQNRKKTEKKLSKSFLPYNAYKILGVSPTITKAQLKKVYRTLAKKYHPDKYYGQSKETIQRAKDKFQEILEAYEIVLKYKIYN